MMVYQSQLKRRDPHEDDVLRRHRLGQVEAGQLGGPALVTALETAGHSAPSLGRAIMDDAFGATAATSTLDYRDWALLTIGELIALGDCPEQIRLYLDAALAADVTDSEVADLLAQAQIYVGAPRVVNAQRAMSRILDTHAQADSTHPRTSRVNLGSHNTTVWDNHGSGVPMVLVHALNFDHRFWRAIYPTLGSMGRVIAFDIRGHGGAKGVATESLDQVAEDVGDLLDALEIPTADLYGASYGGAITQKFALAHPDRVRSMALIATFGNSPFELLTARATDAERDGMQAQIAESMIRWFEPESLATNPWYVRYARTLLQRAQVADWANAWRAMASLRVLDELPRLDVPTLVLAGSHDRSTGPADMEMIARALPRSTFRVINGTHMMPMEQPDAVAHELVEFRNSVDRQIGRTDHDR